jgi:hypothetical protein
MPDNIMQCIISQSRDDITAQYTSDLGYQQSS